MSRLDWRFMTSAIFVGLLLGIDMFFDAWVPDTREPIYQRLPYQMGEWQGTDVEISEEELDQILAGGRMAAVQRVFESAGGDLIDTVVIYIERPEAIRHTPERCLTVSGWSVDRISTTAIPLMPEKRATIGNLITGLKADHKILQLYVFANADGYSRTAMQTLIDYSRRGLAHRDQTMALVMMSTVIPRREFEGEAVAMMSEFAGLYLPHVKETMQ